MPKSKRRRRPHKRGHREHQQDISWGGISARSTTRTERVWVPIAIVVFLVAVGVFVWWTTFREDPFETLADAGGGALLRVVTEADAGREHLQPGQTHTYPVRYPTSGLHAPNLVNPGVYDTPQEPTRLVHSLEHGHIVIYVGRPREGDMATLAEWADRFDGRWDGVIVTPDPGLGRRIVMTAWRRRLELNDFDAAAVAAFIDAYRGRGPENPVR